MADFPPVLVAGGRGGPALRRALRSRHRLLAAGLAVAAAGATLTAARTVPSPPGEGARGNPAGVTAAERAGPEAADAATPGSDPAPAAEPGDRTVAAPVRIADAAAVELLRPGDRVDVIAVGAVRPDDAAEAASAARVVAQRALVREVPQRTGSAVRGSVAEGALVVLEVSRRTATELAGAAGLSPLAVTLC